MLNLIVSVFEDDDKMRVIATIIKNRKYARFSLIFIIFIIISVVHVSRTAYSKTSTDSYTRRLKEPATSKFNIKMLFVHLKKKAICTHQTQGANWKHIMFLMM